MSDYLADVQRYDADAGAEAVDKIVRHLGIALRSRDASLVSCSDDLELDRVKEKWCIKKLGVGAEAADKTVTKVCEQMSGDRNKARVTFYYLCAKELGRLDVL